MSEEPFQNDKCKRKLIIHKGHREETMRTSLLLLCSREEEWSKRVDYGCRNKNKGESEIGCKKNA